METNDLNNYIPGTNFPKAPMPVGLDPSVPNDYEDGYIAKKEFSKALENAMNEEYGYAPDPMSGYDPETRRSESQRRLRQMENEIRASVRGSYADRQQVYQGLAAGIQSATSLGGLVGGSAPISVESAYNITPSGKMIPRTKTYIEGINNEDALARTQTNAEKRWNGLGKLVSKTALNVLGNIVGLAYGAVEGFRNWNFESFMDNSFNRWLNEQNEILDYYLPHYYTEEAKKENFFQRLFTANGFWNDLVGNGLPFVLATMLTMRGGFMIGLGKMGTTGARIGMRVAARKAAAQGVKASLGTLKTAASIGRGIGDIGQTLVTLTAGTNYEAMTESFNMRLDAEDRFKDYIKNTTGRNPTMEEMAKFRQSTAEAMNGVFWANMGIVGLSNWLLLGKFAGLGKTYWGEKLAGHFDDFGKFVNTKAFGVGVKKGLTEAGRMEMVKSNLLQKTLHTTWNVAKRPLSEGMFEEGLQGVAQRTAEEFIDSRYNKLISEQNVGFWDALRQSFADQYTSKDGWMEIGMGAVIGAMFGVNKGFGFLEGYQQRSRVKDLVDAYNQGNVLTPAGIAELARQTMIVNSQVAANMKAERVGGSPNVNVMAGQQEDIFNKLRLSDELGMLDEHSNEILEYFDKLDPSALAKELGIEKDAASEYKQKMKDQFSSYVEAYKESKDMVNAILPENLEESYKTYVQKTVFDGMDAQANIKVLSDHIGRMMGQETFSQYIQDAAKLSRSSYEVGEELKAKMDEIGKLEKELEVLAASRPAAGDPKAASFDTRVKELTSEIEKLRDEYADAERRAVRSVSEDFNKADFLDISKTLSSGSVSGLTGEEILAAVDAVDTIDDRIAEARKAGKTGIADDTLSSLARLYRDNAVAVKRAANLISSLTDRQFLNSSYTRFRAIEEEGRKRFMKIDTKDRDLQINLTETDSKIDQMLSDGKITEEEANGLKFFNHLRDGITRVSSEPVEYVEGGVRTSLMGKERLEDLTAAELETVERIARKRLNGVEELTAFEAEIYNKFKEDIDKRSERMGTNLSSTLDRLRKYNDLIKRRDDEDYYNDFKRYVLEGQSKEDVDAFNEAEKAYRKNWNSKNGKKREEAKKKLNEAGYRLGLAIDFSDVVDADENSKLQKGKPDNTQPAAPTTPTTPTAPVTPKAPVTPTAPATPTTPTTPTPPVAPTPPASPITPPPTPVTPSQGQDEGSQEGDNDLPFDAQGRGRTGQDNASTGQIPGDTAGSSTETGGQSASTTGTPGQAGQGSANPTASSVELASEKESYIPGIATLGAGTVIDSIEITESDILGLKAGDEVEVKITRRFRVEEDRETYKDFEFQVARNGRPVGLIYGDGRKKALYAFWKNSGREIPEGGSLTIGTTKIKAINHGIRIMEEDFHPLSEKERGKVKAAGYMMNGKLYMHGDMDPDSINLSLMHPYYRGHGDQRKERNAASKDVRYPFVVIEAPNGDLVAVKVNSRTDTAYLWPSIMELSEVLDDVVSLTDLTGDISHGRSVTVEDFLALRKADGAVSEQKNNAVSGKRKTGSGAAGIVEETETSDDAQGQEPEAGKPRGTYRHSPGRKLVIPGYVELPVLDEGIADDPYVANVTDANRGKIADILASKEPETIVEWLARLIGLTQIRMRLDGPTGLSSIFGLYPERMDAQKRNLRRAKIDPFGWKRTKKGKVWKDRAGNVVGWVRPRETLEKIDLDQLISLVRKSKIPAVDAWRRAVGIGDNADAPVTEAMRDALRFELYRLFEDVALTVPGSRGGTEGDIEYSPYKMLQFALASVVGTDSRASDEIEAIALAYSHIYGKKLSKRGTPEEIQKTTDEAMDDIDRIQKSLQKNLSAFSFSTDLSLEEVETPAEAKDVRDVYNMDPVALRSLAIEHKYDSVRDLLEDLRKFVERNPDLSDLDRNDLINEINEKINEYENTSGDQQLSETELTNTNGEEGAGRPEGESEPGAGEENQHRDDSLGDNAGGEVLQPLTEDQLYHRLTAQYGFVKDNRKGKNLKGDKYKVKRVKRNGEIGDDFGNKQQGRTFLWEVSFGEHGTLGFYPKEKTDDYYIAWVPAGTKEGGVVGLLHSTGVVEMGIAESVGVLSEISGKPLIGETAVPQSMTNPTIVETVASLFEREGSAMEPNASMEREPVVRFEPGSVDANPNGETRLYNQRILFESPETDPVQTAVSIPVDYKGRFGGPSEAVISAKVDGELREIGRITMDGMITFNDDAAVYKQDNDGLFDIEGKKGTANELFPSLFENKSSIPSDAAATEENTTEEKRSIIDIMGSEYKAKAKEQINKPC